MKSIISLLGITALALATSARAQEESPSPTPGSEEHASATVEAPSTLRESSPTPSPQEKSSAAAPDAQKKEAPSTNPTPAAQKKEVVAASVAAPAPPKVKSAGPDKGSAEANVKRLENEWEASVMKHDPSFLQSRVADDFTGTSSKGKRQNKSGLLKDFKIDTDTYTSAKNGSISVRSFGNNIAIATGTSKEVGKGKDGKAFSRAYAWTDTWMLRGSQWQCIASQTMLIVGK